MRTDFARLVEQCGLIFVGPSADIIEKLGNKSTAKRIMKEAGVPVVPGSKDVVETVEEGLERSKGNYISTHHQGKCRAAVAEA